MSAAPQGWLCAAVIIGLGILPVCGCKQEPASAATAGHDHDRDEADEPEHGGHHNPAHRPKDLPAAVKRLRELNHELDIIVNRGKGTTPAEDHTLPIALDIATWLPEIAADSDLPKPMWDKVSSQSEVIVSNYRSVLDASAKAQPGGATSAVRANEQPIAVLEKVIAEADPRWFRKTP